MWETKDYVVLIGFLVVVFFIFVITMSSIRADLVEEQNQYEQRLERDQQAAELVKKMDEIYNPTEFKIGDTIFQEQGTTFNLKGITLAEFIVETKNTNNETSDKVYPANMESFFELGETGMFVRIKEVNSSKGTAVFYFMRKGEDKQ